MQLATSLGSIPLHASCPKAIAASVFWPEIMLPFRSLITYVVSSVHCCNTGSQPVVMMDKYLSSPVGRPAIESKTSCPMNELLLHPYSFGSEQPANWYWNCTSQSHQAPQGGPQ